VTEGTPERENGRQPVGLVVVGLSYHTAALEKRERATYSARELPEVLRSLRTSGAREAVVLSTCNRTEFYLVGPHEESVDAVSAILSERLGESSAPYLVARRDREAVAHLFRVAAGLDSMVLGEAQVAGQVRAAWEGAREHSSTVLNRAFQTAALVGHRVREETNIGRGAASVSSAAVQLAKQIFGSLLGVRAMVLGAGDMADLALKSLASEGVTTAIVSSRTAETAAALAERHLARAVPLTDVWTELAEIDLLVTGTSSETPVVTRDRLAPALRSRRDRPLFILDIAVPRDVAPDVGRLDNVFLYDIDDLKAVVASSLERRRSELPAAERVVQEEVTRFWNWLGSLSAVPTLTEFRGQMDRIRERELALAMKKLGHLTPEQRTAFDQFSRALMNKFLHEPSVKLREAAAQQGGLETVDAVRYLFGLPGSEGEPERGSGRTHDNESK
jgi:glutamyl-tRNA reductase